MNMNFLRILKMVMNFKHKFAIVKNYRWDRNLWCEVANIRKTIIYGGKQHCNVSKANIGLIEHVQCTCMSDSLQMSIPKFRYKLQTYKIKSSKLSPLI